MIYSVYFAGISIKYQRSVFDSSTPTPIQAKMEGRDPRQVLANIIKQSKGDKYVFITTKSQETEWEKFIKENELGEFIEYEMPDYVTNGNHDYMGRNLKLHVLTSKE